MRSSSLLRRRGLSLLLALLVGLLPACGDAPTPTPIPATPVPTPAPGLAADRTPQAMVPTVEGYGLRVTRGGQVLKTFTAAELLTVPQELLDIGGRPMAGAPLRAVLALAGVTEAEQLTITGTDALRSGPVTVTLAWAAVTDDVLLGINKRGAGKLFGPNLPGEQWVVDVTEIAVSP
jgi:hypothetical protein